MPERQPSDTTLRLFIAFDLPGEIKQELAQIQAAWQHAAGSAAASVKWVATPGIHLTLKFLGPTPAAQLDLIRLALAAALATVHPLPVRLAGLGVFPNPQRPRVLWVGLAGEVTALAALQQRVERALAPLGHRPEDRRFQPHLTLGRVRDDAGPAERRALGTALGQIGTPRAASFTLDVLHVMRSELRREGARYTSLAQIPLPATPSDTATR